MKKNPVIISYAGANLSSLQFAIERIGYDVCISSSHKKIKGASHLFLPGVGEAGDAMNKIKDSSLKEILLKASQPTLGICLGMQLLFSESEEGNTKCLNIINGRATKFENNNHMPVPHMGWNLIKNISKSIITKNINGEQYGYFVHSYLLPQCESTVSTTNYGITFSSIVEKNNFFGTQFHPERSSSYGEKILKNFMEIN